jgi:hypothetical protein
VLVLVILEFRGSLFNLQTFLGWLLFSGLLFSRGLFDVGRLLGLFVFLGVLGSSLLFICSLLCQLLFLFIDVLELGLGLNTPPALELTFAINVLATDCEEGNDQSEQDSTEYYNIDKPVIELVYIWGDLCFQLGVEPLHRVVGC